MNSSKLNNLTKPAALLLLFITSIIILPGGISSHAAAGREVITPAEMKPVGHTEYRAMAVAVAGGGRRRLAPFQLCLLCKCCAGATCASMPCCFGIDCQLPNKPFGVCAFVPKTCNCNSCSS